MQINQGGTAETSVPQFLRDGFFKEGLINSYHSNTRGNKELLWISKIPAIKAGARGLPAPDIPGAARSAPIETKEHCPAPAFDAYFEIHLSWHPERHVGLISAFANQFRMKKYVF